MTFIRNLKISHIFKVPLVLRSEIAKLYSSNKFNYNLCGILTSSECDFFFDLDHPEHQLVMVQKMLKYIAFSKMIFKADNSLK